MPQTSVLGPRGPERTRERGMKWNARREAESCGAGSLAQLS
jgi:hypothetical protein